MQKIQISSASHELEFRLLFYFFGADRAAAILTEIFVQFSVWKKEQKTLSNRRGLSTFRTVESGGLKLIKLLMLILPSAHY